MKLVCRTSITIIIISSIIVFILPSCKLGDNGSSDGVLNIILVDSPSRIQNMKIDVEAVSIHRTGSAADVGWSTVNREPLRNIDLVTLRNGNYSQLVLSKVSIGKYDKIKILFGPCSVTEGMKTTAFAYNSTLQYGYIQNYNFEITGDEQCELAFDVDIYKSISQVGPSYYFNPVFRVQDVKLTGWIQGAVVDSNKHAVFVTIQTMVLTDSVTTLNDTTASGSFMLSGLPAKIYSIKIIPFDLSSLKETILDSIVVNQKEKKNIGQIVLRP